MSMKHVAECTTVDAVDELVARAKDHPELRKFHDFHRQHPEVLDFLVLEIGRRLDNGFRAFSYGSLWDYARWKLDLQKGPGETFRMNDHVAPFYSRVIPILHPQFNGRAEYRIATADSLFGLEREPVQSKLENYARRLQWVGGTSLESGWRPEHPHVPREAMRRVDIHRKPVQRADPSVPNLASDARA